MRRVYRAFSNTLSPAGPAPLRLFVVAAALLLALPACARDEEALRREVQRLALAEGDDVRAQVERVGERGRPAIPSIEAVMHTTEEPGRRNLVLALGRIGDPETVPLLQHIAIYDAAEAVRREAESTLRAWAGQSDPRGDKARAAVRRVEELRKRQEAG